jgi:hypothetical protein
MKIQSLRTISGTKSVVSLEDNPRNSFICLLENVLLTGRNIHYPNCLLLENKTRLISPYDEKVMSLKKESFYDNNIWDFDYKETVSIVEEPCFFFHYNVDNYYHFVYDTLPILYHYFKMKESNTNLKLLIQTSHPNNKSLPPFVNDFLHSLNIHTFDFGQENTLYKKLFVGSSLTHGGFSNEAPSPYASVVWNSLKGDSTDQFPKRFYISRRSWVHGKTENMGTNYTMRRRCMNEDEVVNLLHRYNIEEVFTELLTTSQKIKLFMEAELVVGVIGGGMCNLLFAPAKTKTLCIITPYFLDINERFKYSMNHTNILFSESSSLDRFEGEYSLYSRVKVKETGIIGEVEGYNQKKVVVRLSKNDVAGFSQNFPCETSLFEEDELEALDFGLNSPYLVNLEKLEDDLKRLSDTKSK